MGKKSKTLKIFFDKEDFEPLYDPVLISVNLILKAQLHPNALKLLRYMSEKATTFKPEIHLTAEEIQKELGFSKKTFYRWLKQLIELGLVKRIAKNIYKVNFQAVYCEVEVPDSDSD